MKGYEKGRSLAVDNDNDGIAKVTNTRLVSFNFPQGYLKVENYVRKLPHPDTPRSRFPTEASPLLNPLA